MERTVLIGYGLLVALFAVLFWTLGLSLGQIISIPSLSIVIIGCISGMLLSCSAADVQKAVKAMKAAFAPWTSRDAELIDDIVKVANQARRDGLLSLEGVRKEIRDPVLAQLVKYVMDGLELREVREVLHTRAEESKEEALASVRVWEVGAQFAPSLGLIGAILGFVQTLAHPAQGGGQNQALVSGMVSAFLSVLYGILFAQFLFMPLASRLKSLVDRQSKAFQILEMGISGVVDGESPTTLKEKLEALL